MSKSTYRRSGFTLVELLVVIAIIGVLVGLLLPAVQAAREAMRRASCLNNIRQVALACQSHVSAHNKLPKNNCLPNASPTGLPDRRGNSWVFGTLPYMEQNTLYDAIELTPMPIYGKVLDPYFTNAAYNNMAAVGQSIPMYLCASDSTTQLAQRGEPAWFTNTGLLMGITNYKGVMGSFWVDPTTLPDFTNTANWRSQHKHLLPKFDYVALNQRFSANNGPLYPGIQWTPSDKEICATTPGDIKDGMSNTFLVGESVAKFAQRNAWAHPIMSCGTTFIALNAKAACVNTSNKYADLEACAADFENNSGFGSYHTGGGNFAFCDGSARFISDGIDIDVYRRVGSMADGLPAKVDD